MGFSIPRLYAIIDPTRAGGRLPAVIARELLSAGVRLIQFRDKRASSRQLYETCVELKALLRDSGCSLVVNDRADVARAMDADGVHLGQDDLPVEMARRVLAPDKGIGFSTHSLDQVVEADSLDSRLPCFWSYLSHRQQGKPRPCGWARGLAAGAARYGETVSRDRWDNFAKRA